MISVKEAKKLISENINALSPVRLLLQNAAGFALAEDVFATADVPAFPQSSRDGYAFNFNAWQKNKQLKIAGEIAAGFGDTNFLEQQNAVRIFTGAAVPDGADTVVMQEKIKTENGLLIIDDEDIKQGAFVRAKGSEIKARNSALEKENILTPAAIGFLSGIGIAEVAVYPKPFVSIIITGNELQQPGAKLLYGQVYESNSFSLKAALKQIHFDDIKIYHVKDDLETLTDILSEALLQSDVVLFTGGVSVGDYDFVAQSAKDNGAEKIFHNVKQRPGKPFYFGKKENKYIFGLPGNPASVLTCFYEYVLNAFEKMCNQKLSLQSITVPLKNAFKKPAGLTHFLKGFYDGNAVTLLNAQESFQLSSFAKANCLIQVDENITECKAGETVEIHLLPQ